MDFGIKKLRAPATAGLGVDVRRNNASSERDAQGHSGYHKQPPRATQLTGEQEDAAVAKLNALPGMAGSGLKAEVIRGDGLATHVVVKNAQGAIIRNIPYEQLIDLYVERNTGNETGRLLRRAA